MGKFNPASADRADFTALLAAWKDETIVLEDELNGVIGQISQTLNLIAGTLTPLKNEVHEARGGYNSLGDRLDVDTAALAEIVDSGAKNRIVPLTSGGATSRGIVFTYNPDGTIAVSGQNDNTGDSNATYRTMQGDFSGYVISGTKYGGVIRLLDASTNSVIVSINRTTPSNVIPQNSASSIKIQLVIPQGSTDAGFIMYPIICSKPAWDISQKYVQYCPTMAELYQMILALQNGTRSVPAETRGDLRSSPDLTSEVESTDLI